MNSIRYEFRWYMPEQARETMFDALAMAGEPLVETLDLTQGLYRLSDISVGKSTLVEFLLAGAQLHGYVGSAKYIVWSREDARTTKVEVPIRVSHSALARAL